MHGATAAQAASSENAAAIASIPELRDNFEPEDAEFFYTMFYKDINKLSKTDIKIFENPKNMRLLESFFIESSADKQELFLQRLDNLIKLFDSKGNSLAAENVINAHMGIITSPGFDDYDNPALLEKMVNDYQELLKKNIAHDNEMAQMRKKLQEATREQTLKEKLYSAAQAVGKVAQQGAVKVVNLATGARDTGKVDDVADLSPRDMPPYTPSYVMSTATPARSAAATSGATQSPQDRRSSTDSYDALDDILLAEGQDTSAAAAAVTPAKSGPRIPLLRSVPGDESFMAAAAAAQATDEGQAPLVRTRVVTVSPSSSSSDASRSMPQPTPRGASFARGAVTPRFTTGGASEVTLQRLPTHMRQQLNAAKAKDLTKSDSLNSFEMVD